MGSFGTQLIWNAHSCFWIERHCSFQKYSHVGAINHCFRRQIDWQELKTSLIRCGELWGNLTAKKPNYALYSGTCMSGSGLAPVGKTYHDRFPHHFQLVLQSNSFDKVCKSLAEGIDSFEKFEALVVSMSDLRN